MAGGSEKQQGHMTHTGVLTYTALVGFTAGRKGQGLSTDKGADYQIQGPCKIGIKAGRSSRDRV